MRSGFLRPIGYASAAAGLLIGARAVEPGMLATLGTLELLGIVLLVLGPIATMLALRYDRRCASQTIPSESVTLKAARTATHEAHTRSIPAPGRSIEMNSDSKLPEQAA